MRKAKRIRIRQFQFWAGISLSLLSVTSIFSQKNEQLHKRIKKRVAILTFEDQTDGRWHWWDRKNVGEGLSDMILTELLKTEQYHVVARPQLDKFLQEHSLDALTPQSVAKVGDLLGVEFVVMGVVTEFGYDTKRARSRMKGFGLGIQDKSATVELECQLVSTATADMITTETVRREKSSRGIQANTHTIDFRSQRDFDESLVGKAARDAVRDVIKLINESAPQIFWQAKVIREKMGLVYIDAGSEIGVAAGDRFFVYRKGA
ncbi:MAG: CsgG/HfaB family protein [bacterium]